MEEASSERAGGRCCGWRLLVEDPGRAITRQAVAKQVDLVIGAVGDGTIRYVADGLAHWDSAGAGTGRHEAAHARFAAAMNLCARAGEAGAKERQLCFAYISALRNRRRVLIRYWAASCSPLWYLSGDELGTQRRS
jgi:hypothetical protein